MIVAILQARMSSTRLPGKVLKPIEGEPMLARQLERLSRLTRVDKVVVATSDDPGDDAVAALCAELGTACYRGSLPDVLDRFHKCAETYGADHVVRLTGDCPLTDPGLIDELVGFYLDGGYDYAANCRPPTLPDGLDAEIFTAAALAEAWEKGETKREREHVVPYIIDRPDVFRCGNWSLADADHSGLRWTVDEPEDLEFVRRVYAALYPADPAFTWRDVLRLLDEQPELATLNMHHERNAGAKSGG